MTLYGLYKVLENLNLKQAKKEEVFALLDNRKVKLEVKRMANGTPYFIEKK